MEIGIEIGKLIGRLYTVVEIKIIIVVIIMVIGFIGKLILLIWVFWWMSVIKIFEGIVELTLSYNLWIIIYCDSFIHIYLFLISLLILYWLKIYKIQ